MFLEDAIPLFFRDDAVDGVRCAVAILELVRKEGCGVGVVLSRLGKGTKSGGENKFYYGHIEQVWDRLYNSGLIEWYETSQGKRYRLSPRLAEWLIQFGNALRKMI